MKPNIALCFAGLIWLLAVGSSFPQEVESTGSEASEYWEACHADPYVCLAQKRAEFETRGTFGLDLFPQMVGETTQWVVHGFRPGSTSEHSGLEHGDILLLWNGEPTSTPEDPRRLTTLAQQVKVGEEVEMHVRRGTETKTFTLTAAAPSEKTIRTWLHYFSLNRIDEEVVDEFFRREDRRLENLAAPPDPDL